MLNLVLSHWFLVILMGCLASYLATKLWYNSLPSRTKRISAITFLKEVERLAPKKIYIRLISWNPYGGDNFEFWYNHHFCRFTCRCYRNFESGYHLVWGITDAFLNDFDYELEQMFLDMFHSAKQVSLANDHLFEKILIQPAKFIKDKKGKKIAI